MDFSYSDEQRMLKDMVDRVVADQYDFEARTKIVDSETGFSADLWSQFAELGLLAVPFSEAAGGFDGGGAELMVVAEGFGRGRICPAWCWPVRSSTRSPVTIRRRL